MKAIQVQIKRGIFKRNCNISRTTFCSNYNIKGYNVAILIFDNTAFASEDFTSIKRWREVEVEG